MNDRWGRPDGATYGTVNAILVEVEKQLRDPGAKNRAELYERHRALSAYAAEIGVIAGVIPAPADQA